MHQKAEVEEKEEEVEDKIFLIFQIIIQIIVQYLYILIFKKKVNFNLYIS